MSWPWNCGCSGQYPINAAAYISNGFAPPAAGYPSAFSGDPVLLPGSASSTAVTMSALAPIQSGPVAPGVRITRFVPAFASDKEYFATVPYTPSTLSFVTPTYVPPGNVGGAAMQPGNPNTGAILAAASAGLPTAVNAYSRSGVFSPLETNSVYAWRNLLAQANNPTLQALGQRPI